MTLTTAASKVTSAGSPGRHTERRARSTDPQRRRRGPQTLGQWSVLGACTVLALVMLMPVYVIVATALSGSQAAPSFFLTFPTPASLKSFATAWHEMHGSILNSLQITVPATIVSCLIGSINGYILSKFPFRYSTLLFTLLLVGMYVPYLAVIIPLFQFLSLVHIQGTILGLIIVNTVYGIPITTLIFRNYYEGIPGALVEAASIDGAGIWRTYTRVMLPLSAPGFVVAGIFQFTNIWNDFLFGFILASPASWPATVSLNNIIGDTSVNYSQLMAGAIFVAAPTVLIYLTLSRYFVRGLTAGSVK